MSKAILVMNMPDSCVGCPLCKREEDNLYYCMATFKIIVDVCLKAHWCPLREVPQKKDEWIPTVIQDIEVCGRKKDKFVSGYNACIDEIMKGVEENG